MDLREERGRRAYLWERGIGGAKGASSVLGDPAGAVRALLRHEPVSGATRPRGVPERREGEDHRGREGERVE
jgi:hypothetical protein